MCYICARYGLALLLPANLFASLRLVRYVAGFGTFFLPKCFLLLSSSSSSSSSSGTGFFFRLPFTGRLSSFSFFLYTICGNPVSPTEKNSRERKRKSFFDEPVRIVIVILVQALSLSSRIFSSFERAFVDVN